MKPNQLTLVAFLRAQPGKGDELGSRLQALIAPTRSEPGNINYDLHRSNEDPDLWMLYENWTTPADLEAHFQQPYLKAFISRLDEVLQGDMDLRRFSMQRPRA
jgi:quinol monooxygenase YgiN